ncbi:hypothetical protein OH77DRAFT_1456692 [Trametes cingulata]|nr:hypothetical protein OH77DRAFT_1456692 [Trametes cingulata]
MNSLFSLADDALLRILSHCSAPSLGRLRGASQQADAYVADEFERRYRNLLHPYVHDQKAFRAQLDICSALISGSGSLRVTGGFDFTPGDLDIYVPSHNLFHMLGYLVHVEGYAIQAFCGASVEGDYVGGIQRLVRLTRGSFSIDLVQSLTDAASLPIPHFWSTAVMTYLTGNTVGVLYPGLLEDRRALLNPLRLHAFAVARIPVLVEKYTRFGFDFKEREVDWISEDGQPSQCKRTNSPSCPFTVRWIGDRFEFHASILRVRDRVGRPAAPKRKERLTSVWWRGGIPCGGDCSTDGVAIESGIWTQPVDHVMSPSY